MFCKNCGKEVNEKAVVCINCGVPPLTEKKFCQSCGVETKPNQVVCVKCGVSLEVVKNKNTSGSFITSGSDAPISPSELDLKGLSPYYQEEFKRICESEESYKGKWNWAAFLFGPIWALTKGAWLPAVICVALSFFCIGFFYWFVFGLRGNYMYYTLHTKKKQSFA